MPAFAESIVREAALNWLGELGYAVYHGPEMAPGEAFSESPGMPVEYVARNGRIIYDTARLLDFEDPDANDFMAVNQVTVREGQHTRRPDIVVFLNGLPVAVIELKNAADENATIWSAFNQDPLLRDSGRLVSFRLVDQKRPLDPPTAFYDWLYVNALQQLGDEAEKLLDYGGFTDIAFNPAKSLNCQARSAALYVALRQLRSLDAALRSQADFRRDRNREVDFVARRGPVLAAIEVKSGRSRDTHPGLEAFASGFDPARVLLVGGDGIPLEEFLLTPAARWVASSPERTPGPTPLHSNRLSTTAATRRRSDLLAGPAVDRAVRSTPARCPLRDLHSH